MKVPHEEEYTALIKSRLDERRFYHSLCVADSSEELALRYGADPVKARTAGLLHDLFKNAGRDEVFGLFDRYSFRPDEITVSQKKLWHACAGALYIGYVLGLDEDVVNAVRYHTTGRAGMSLLEKVVFIADFISADRDYPGVERVREKAERSLEEAMTEGLQFTITELCGELKPVHPDSVACYNELVNGGNNGKA
ncbi:MAG: bis(5'-nucleosyl)-tetraphosphatase (symmetrical) YqeK [Clostridia bacterium]|nr:bis(5'-nucleosyl)-tetraphosphatase (symmetrical) YqeK [Clostridia bacterium]